MFITSKVLEIQRERSHRPDIQCRKHQEHLVTEPSVNGGRHF
jgi:hypothetical protein